MVRRIFEEARWYGGYSVQSCSAELITDSTGARFVSANTLYLHHAAVHELSMPIYKAGRAGSHRISFFL